MKFVTRAASKQYYPIFIFIQNKNRDANYKIKIKELLEMERLLNVDLKSIHFEQNISKHNGK